MPARSPSTEDYLPGDTCQITAHLSRQYLAAPTAEGRACSGSIFLKNGGCPDSSGRVQEKIRGYSFQNPFLCSSPRVHKCRLGKGEKSGDSGSLRVQSQLGHSGPRLTETGFMHWAGAFQCSNPPTPMEVLPVPLGREQRLEAVWYSREMVCR